jgi:pilus assembly protein CpaF
MNTGHDGSMCTLHANTPREALMRLENMILMSDLKVPRD